MLLSKAVEKLHASPEGQDEGPGSQGCRAPVAPFDMCRLHQLFSGASLMARYSPTIAACDTCKQQ